MRRVVHILTFLSILSALNVHAEGIAQMRCPEGMVYVPAGKSVIGSNEPGPYEPRRTVYLEAFYIDQYPVTNAQFKAFVDATEYRTVAEEVGKAVISMGGQHRRVQGANWRGPEGPASTIEGRMDYPVVHVAHRDAEAYCRWVEKRLPTEEEWEKACRGTDGRKFPWGNDWQEGRHAPPRAKEGIFHHRVSPVGKYPYGSSPYGVMDMVGNIRQWCATSEKNYSRRIPWVVKGDPWGSSPHCAWRSIAYDEEVDVAYQGFRCAKDAQQW